MKMRAQNWVFLIVFFAGMISIADITSAIRNSKAVVHYDFEDDFSALPDSGVEFLDKSSIGTPLNLKWYASDRTKIQFGRDASNDGYLWIRGSTIYRYA
jgi:hypothetical protein